MLHPLALDTPDAMHAEMAIRVRTPRRAVLPLDRFDDDLVNVGGTHHVGGDRHSIPAEFSCEGPLPP